jgi:molecular chaperone Hsp33
LAFTVDQKSASDRYQGVVELQGKTLADSVYHYFAQSEQLQTTLKIAARQVTDISGKKEWRAGALMLQRLPPDADASRIVLNAEEMQEDWNRCNFLLDTVRAEELTDPAMSSQELLVKLFHEEGVRVYETHHLVAQCRCGREKIFSTLKSFPMEELKDMFVAGKITVKCEFCSSNYEFTFTEFDDKP